MILVGHTCWRKVIQSFTDKNVLKAMPAPFANNPLRGLSLITKSRLRREINDKRPGTAVNDLVPAASFPLDLKLSIPVTTDGISLQVSPKSGPDLISETYI